MRISNTIIAPLLKAILLATLIGGCSYGLKMNMETEASTEVSSVFVDFLAIADRDISYVKNFLDQNEGSLRETYEWEGSEYTLLHYAAEKGILWLVKELIDKRKVEVDIKTRDSGATPLQCAAQNGHLAVVEELLDLKANVFEKDKRDATALHYAASGGQLEVFEYLKTFIGDDRPTKDKDGLNLLHLVALSVNKRQNTTVALERSKKLAAFIMDAYGANMIQEPDSKTGQCTPLHLAARNGNDPLVKLMKEKSDRASYDKIKHSAALTAYKQGHITTVKLILEK